MSNCSQDSPDAKKPCKGILKSSSSFDKPPSAGSHGHRKSAKFDEINVLQTYHPPDKDYGHMKIEEPKTPYNYSDARLAEQDQLDATVLTEKLEAAARRLSVSEEGSDSEEEHTNETEEEKARRLEFEKRRKAHYKEFEAVKLARKLIEEEDDEDEDDDIKNDDQQPSSSSKGFESSKMDIDVKNNKL